MKLLLKTALLLAAIFATTFIVIKVTGVLTVEDIESGFERLHAAPVYWIGGLVVLLLFADLFIAVPTMTVIMLAGFFLGFTNGLMFSLIGCMLAAFTGYTLSWFWGDRVLRKVENSQQKRQQMYDIFNRQGMLVLILSRAMPILPEVSACLAGICKMPFLRFVLGWSLGTIPYLLIVNYAGSISDLDNPFPAILTAIGVTGTLWLAWVWKFRGRVVYKQG